MNIDVQAVLVLPHSTHTLSKYQGTGYTNTSRSSHGTLSEKHETDKQYLVPHSYTFAHWGHVSPSVTGDYCERKREIKMRRPGTEAT